MNLTFLGPIRAGGGATVVLSGAPAYAGVAWRLASGAGELSGASSAADAAGVASAYYQATGDATGETIRVEVDVYA